MEMLLTPEQLKHKIETEQEGDIGCGAMNEPNKHLFTPQNIGEDEPPSSFCAHCGEYLTHKYHYTD